MNETPYCVAKKFWNFMFYATRPDRRSRTVPVERSDACPTLMTLTSNVCHCSVMSQRPCNAKWTTRVVCVVCTCKCSSLAWVKSPNDVTPQPVPRGGATCSDIFDDVKCIGEHAALVPIFSCFLLLLVSAHDFHSVTIYHSVSLSFHAQK